jgi:hypothetical protein
MKIFQGMRLMDGACRIRQLTSSLIQSIIKFVVVLMKHAGVRRFSQIHAGSNTIDLHGLFVPEAKQYFDDAVRGARDRGESLLYVIVGKKPSIAHSTPATGFSLIAKLLRKRKWLRKQHREDQACNPRIWDEVCASRMYPHKLVLIRDIVQFRSER